MALTGLKKDGLRLILFGGKGGVGKTTCASSTGLYLAESFKTLLISTDPAHSLSDSLGQRFSNEITQVRGIKDLYALEISAEEALSKFKLEYEDEIRKIFDTSTYLDKDDIDSIMSLPIPGMDEVMGFKTIVDLIEEAKYDKYIVDTAPTGHALRLLTLPELLDDWIKVMAKMKWKYRYIVTTFGGSYHPDEADDFLVKMKKAVKKIEGLLKDKARCEFIAVTIPEEMAILETERFLTNLSSYGMMVRQLVINNTVEAKDNCIFCRERRRNQEIHIKRMKKRFRNLRIITIPLWPRQVRGIEDLNNFKKGLLQ